MANFKYFNVNHYIILNILFSLIPLSYIIGNFAINLNESEVNSYNLKRVLSKEYALLNTNKIRKIRKNISHFAKNHYSEEKFSNYFELGLSQIIAEIE